MAKFKYQIIAYDVWGNARDGFEVNAAYTTGTYIVIDLENDSDRAINRRLGIRGVTWDGDDVVLYGTVKRNGMPAMELRRAE